MRVTLDGIVREVIPEKTNALVGIVAIPSGMVREDNETQLLNAPVPMLVMFGEKENEVNLMQSPNI